MSVKELVSVGWRKARAIGGGSQPYWEDGAKVTPIREQPTPFAAALRVVDRRDGYAMQIARQWRIMAIGATIVAAGLGGGWWWQAQKQLVQYVEVPIDRLGNPGPVHVPKTFTPNSAVLAGRVRRLIPEAFGLSSDRIINEDRYANLKRSLVGDAKNTWIAWWNANSAAGVTERVVRVVAIKPTASPNTYNAIWDETDIKDGAEVARRRVNGDFTVAWQPPADVASAMDIDVCCLPITAMRFATEVQ